MLTMVKTSRRQGQHCEVWSEGSLSAKRGADEQESDRRLSSRVEQAQDCDGRNPRCTVNPAVVSRQFMLLSGEICGVCSSLRTARGAAMHQVYTTEVSRGRSSEKGDGGSTGEGPKKQTRQCAIMLEVYAACVKREVSHGA